MEGLKYLLSEIQLKRPLLKLGKPSEEVWQYINEHRKPPGRELDSTNPSPNGYEIKEVMEYWPGRTAIRFYLAIPTLINADRWLCIYVEKRKAQKSLIKHVKSGVEWTYPGGFEIEDKELEKLLIAAHPYARWEKDKRKARPRLAPATKREDIGGAAIMQERNTGRFFTVPIIVIDEHTQSKMIWEQLLLSAWGNGYFNKQGESLAFSELVKTYPQSYLLTHFRKHTFSPYDATSNIKYIRYTTAGYSKQVKHDESEITYPNGSVRYAETLTGIHWQTIYRLIREGKVKATRNEYGFISLDNNALNYLKDMQKERNKRESRRLISQTAKVHGKSNQAIKKWLQRHRGLSPDEFAEKYFKWLGIASPVRH